MKINPNLGFEQYKKTVNAVKVKENFAGKSALEAAFAQAEMPENTDKVMISGDATARAEIIRITSNLTAEVDAHVDAAKIEELKVAVQQGSYFIPTAVLAEAVLSRGI